MSTLAGQVVSVDQTGQPAQQLPGFDPAPVIAALEQGLRDFLTRPMQQTLNELQLQRFPEESPSDPEGPADPADLANQFDPFQLIAPIISGLGTLGNGQFSGIDPTQIFKGVSDAFDGTTIPLQQAIVSVAHDWQGGSGAAAEGKTRAAVANGAEVATQAEGLRDNLSTAAANVAQARKRMIDIVDEFQAKMAAIDVSTPAGRAAAIAAANEASTQSTAVMEELQGTLGVQADNVSAIGARVQVATAPPGVGGSVVGGPLSSMMGSSGMRPIGVLNTVLSDPRLTPESIVGNFMDLLFLPQTVTELNQGIKQTNGTIGRTNSIMTGLGDTLSTTNGTIGRTNTIMTGLDGRLADTNSTIGRTNSIMTGLGSSLNDATGAINNTNGALGKATAAINDTTGALGDTNRTMGDVNTTMGETNRQLGETRDTMGETNRQLGETRDTMGETNKGLGETNRQLANLNGTLPGPFGGEVIEGTAVPAPR